MHNKDLTYYQSFDTIRSSVFCGYAAGWELPLWELLGVNKIHGWALKTSDFVKSCDCYKECKIPYFTHMA